MTDSEADLLEDIRFFYEECCARLDSLAVVIPMAGTCYSPEAAEKMLNMCHALKGGSRMLGLRSLELLIHKLEEIFIEYAQSRQPMPAETVALLARYTRLLKEKLSAAILMFGNRVAGELAPARLQDGLLDRETWQSLQQLLAVGRRDAADELKQPTPSVNLSRITAASLEELLELPEEALPAARILNPLRQLSLDLAKKEHKQVQLRLDGESLPLPRSVYRALQAPLVQIVRNAIIHGIEPPEQRQTLGKPPEGLIDVSVEKMETPRGGVFQITIADDGRGLDADDLRRAAEAQSGVNLSGTEGALHDLIFTPGLTTREKTDLDSGRGYGLSLAQRQIQDCGGILRVETQAGQGCRFIIQLPAAPADTSVATPDGRPDPFNSGREITPDKGRVVETASSIVEEIAEEMED